MSDPAITEEFKGLMREAATILKDNPGARNNDFYLGILWLRKFGGLSRYIDMIPFSLIQELSGSLSSLSRARRKIQNEFGLYPSTDPVRLKRQDRARKMRKTMPRLKDF